MADAGQTPGADQTLGDEALEQRTHLPDEHRIGRHPAGGVGRPARDEAFVRHDIGMQEEQVEPGQTQALQAPLDGLPQHRFDALGRRVAEVAFAGDPDAGRQSAGEGLADYQFGLAVAIARRQVEQRDPSRHRRMHGGDAFIDRRLAPQHAEAAAPEGERRDRRKRTEGMMLHAGFRVRVRFRPVQRRNAGGRHVPERARS